MTAVRLPRPGVFATIAPERLFALLLPYADFFANRSVFIESPESIDCQAVIHETHQRGQAYFCSFAHQRGLTRMPRH